MLLNEKVITDFQLAQRLRIKINEIAQSMESMHTNSLGIMGGKAGEAIFWAYYLRFLSTKHPNEKVNLILSDIFDQIKSSSISPDFATGLAGVGWTIEHLAQNNFINANTNKIIGNLDDYLYPFMIQYIRGGYYDYLHGALGIGLFYLSRSSNPKPRLYLATLVDELEKQGIRANDSVAWLKKTKDSDHSEYNLSLSHGSASIIVLLSRIYQAGIHQKKVAKLIIEATNFLLSSKQDSKKYIYHFPGWVSKEKPIQGGRLAWCYNDLGVSAALWQAGKLIGNKRWEREAINILLNTIPIIEPIKTRVLDVGICHGAIGIAHVYHRMYTYTNNKAFKDAAIYWFEQSLCMATFKDGLAGYKSFRDIDYGGWLNEYGFLQGIIGIGLSMISAVSDIKPTWDRALLLS